MPDFSENERFRTLLRAYPIKAVTQLYNEHYQSLVAFSNRLSHDQKASEDIVQDAFLNVWENHVRLSEHHSTSIQFYLVKLVKNRSINFYKRSQRIRAVTLALEQLQASANTLDHIIQKETSTLIRRLIQRFPKREQQCLLLQLDQQMSYEQIAQELNVSVKSVERSITSARKRLKRLMHPINYG